MLKSIIIAATLFATTLSGSSAFAMSGNFGTAMAGHQFSTSKELSKGHGWTKRVRSTCDWWDISCWAEIRN